MSSDWIVTFRGHHVYPFEMKLADIDIYDIAHALSLICRFTGHTRQFYSVAEHSVRVSRTCTPANALWGLMHDASEAYIADIARPVKHTPEMQEYRNIETRIMCSIATRFGLPLEMPLDIKEADDALMYTEARDLLRDHDWIDDKKCLPQRIRPMHPEQAELAFLQRYRELGKMNKGESSSYLKRIGDLAFS